MTDAEHDPVADAVEQLLADASAPRRVRAIEEGGSPAALWRAIEASGFADALVPEGRGGAGLGLSGALPIVLACGRHAVPVPFAETMAVRAVLACAGQAWPEGPASFARAAAGGGAVTCHRVPYGRVAEWVLVSRPGSSVLLPVAAAEVTPSRERGSLDADLRWAAPPVDAPVAAGDPPWPAIGAALCAAQLAGAMDRVLALTVAHANERVQFGRSVGKFQAIQQQVSVMAEQVFAARMAARIGCHGTSHLPGELQAAVAKARTSEAAVVVAAIAHAVQGAMGITEEGDLQLYTRRLHAWRLAHGAEHHWNEHIGEALLAGGRGPFATLVRERLSPRAVHG
jgi:alkylation response protein AidB-like acyl-CoA dehydrogenase